MNKIFTKNKSLKAWYKNSTLLLLSLTTLAAPLKAETDTTCTLPKEYVVPGKTFIINENLSCETNIFLHALPHIGLEAEKKVSAEEKAKSSQAVGRVAYELIGDAFAKTKPNVPVSNLKIHSKEGQHEIPVRLYEGKDKDKVIFFTHGGGWSRGNLETHDTLCRHLCEATGASVLAVDYRLSPEHPYPAGLTDAFDAYHWLLDQRSKETKIFVAGDSGGGNIATGLTIKLIQENDRKPDGMILIYPALDLHIPEVTTNPYANGYMLTRDSINAYVNNYTGSDQKKAEDPLVSPVKASDETLKKFPPVILVNAQCDPLAEEGKAFKERLEKLDVSIVHHTVPKTIHIFAQYFDLFPEATEALTFIQENFKKWESK